MKKILGIDNWVFTKKNKSNVQVRVSVYLQYPDIKSLTNIAPGERIKHIRLDQKLKFKKLIDTKLFNNYLQIGPDKSPAGIETKIPYAVLEKINRLSYVGHAFVTNIEGAKRKKDPVKLSFFCVKMTVAIEIESIKKGNQTLEERYVLIKANSSDDAYKKLEKSKKEYAEPYLNDHGLFVRWRIISFDDCYQVEAESLEDFNNPKGVEVYSIFKTRRLNDKNMWDGK